MESIMALFLLWLFILVILTVIVGIEIAVLIFYFGKRQKAESKNKPWGAD